MSVDFTTGSDIDSPTIRTPEITIEVDQWEWPNGILKDTIDITESVLSYQFSKTIKTPLGGAQLAFTPLTFLYGETEHTFNLLNPMDVIRIKEFGKLKFQGYIRRIGTNGSISEDGKPQRNVVANVTHFGGILQEAKLGLQILAYRMKDLDTKFPGYTGAITKLTKAIADKISNGGAKISDIINILITEWFNFLDQMGASQYRSYIDHYIDFDTGLGARDFDTQLVQPKDAAFFYGATNDITIWSELQKLAEVPFNEFFFDEGGRSVWIRSQETYLPENKTYLVGRPTPFDGTFRNGIQQDYWKTTPSKEIPLNRLIRFDFNKTMEDSYSFYLALPFYSGLNELTMMCLGSGLVDENKFAKYLLKPLTMQMFYTTIADKNSTKTVSNIRSLKDECNDASKTLKNWYENNDKFLSGNLTTMVPNDPKDDIYIGDAVKLAGIDGKFYVEGISHVWNYGGPLFSHSSITRGYGDGKPIELKDAIFKGGGFKYDDRT